MSPYVTEPQSKHKSLCNKHKFTYSKKVAGQLTSDFFYTKQNEKSILLLKKTGHILRIQKNITKFAAETHACTRPTHANLK